MYGIGDVILKILLTICVIMLIILLIALGINIYNEITKTEVNRVEITMEIEDKYTRTHTSTSMVGKVPVVRTYKDYFLVYNNGKETEIDGTVYNSVEIGDKIKAEEVTYKLTNDDIFYRIENIVTN